MTLVVGDVPEGHIFLVSNNNIGLLGKGNTQFLKLSRNSRGNVLNLSTWMPAFVKDSVEVTQVIRLANLIPKVLLALAGTNWTLLRQQKEMLLYCKRNEYEVELLSKGLVEFLDAIQDAVVADEIASEKDVFGLDESNDPPGKFLVS